MSEPIRMKVNLPFPDDLRPIADEFKRAGKELFIVGGAVRDAILGKTPKDYDLATDAEPAKVINILHRLPGMRMDLTGKAFGVVRVRTPAPGDNEYEIATFRKDIGSGRRPDAVEFTTIEDDVSRRDLTVNALFYDMETGEAVDYVGGIEDIQNSVIRTVGAPEDRFAEDKLRIMRVARFAGRLGSAVDDETRDAILADNDLTDVSPERITDEFRRGISSAKSASMFLNTIDELQLFPQVFPGMSATVSTNSESTDPAVQVALVLMGNNPKAVLKVLRKMKWTNDEVSDVEWLQQFANVSRETALKLKKRFNATKMSPDSVIAFAEAIGFSRSKAESFLKFAAAPQTVTSQELMAQGLKGQELGAEINRLEGDAYDRMVAEIKGIIRSTLEEMAAERETS